MDVQQIRPSQVKGDAYGYRWKRNAPLRRQVKIGLEFDDACPLQFALEFVDGVFQRRTGNGEVEVAKRHGPLRRLLRRRKPNHSCLQAFPLLIRLRREITTQSS